MEISKHKLLFYELLLVLAAVIWGTNFVPQKTATAYIGPYTFMTIRSFLGALTILFYLIAVRTVKKKQNLDYVFFERKTFLPLLKVAVLCGITTITGSVLVQWGLKYTEASKASFLNTLYIVFVPVLGVVFFKQKTNRNMWLGIFIAIMGLFFLCVKEHMSIALGDLLVISSTLFFATHILLISKFVQVVDGKLLSCLEFFCATIYCLIMALIIEHPTLEQILSCKFALIYSGILGIGICYMLQVTAQKYVNPTIAGLLMSLESVFGAFAGVMMLNERFTFREFIGVVLIAISMVLAQVPVRERVKKYV